MTFLKSTLFFTGPGEAGSGLRRTPQLEKKTANLSGSDPRTAISGLSNLAQKDEGSMHESSLAVKSTNSIATYRYAKDASNFQNAGEHGQVQFQQQTSLEERSVLRHDELMSSGYKQTWLSIVEMKAKHIRWSSNRESAMLSNIVDEDTFSQRHISLSQQLARTMQLCSRLKGLLHSYGNVVTLTKELDQKT